MMFRDEDIRDNEPIRLDQVRVGSTSDARWRGVPEKVEHIDSLEARRVVTAYDRS